MRLLRIVGPPRTIAAYLPSNYKITYVSHHSLTMAYCYIEGEDLVGWTLESYVRPRLESGLWFGLEEIDKIPPDAVEWEE